MNIFRSIHFSVKSKITEILRGVQIYGKKVQTQKWLNGFQQNLASAIYLYRSKSCTTFNLKIFKGGKVLGGVFFFLLHQLLVVAQKYTRPWLSETLSRNDGRDQLVKYNGFSSYLRFYYLFFFIIEWFCRDIGII